MPYGIRKSGEKYKVVNKKTGRVFGTHESEAKAKKQLAALYVNADPKNESKMLDVRLVMEGGYVGDASIQVIEEAVKKEILQKASTSLGIDPQDLMKFIEEVDTEPSLPHGNWICMVASKGMPLDERTKAQLKLQLGFFAKYKEQVVRAGQSGNIFDYPTYNDFKQMIFSFAKAAYDYDPTELPGVSKILDVGPYTLYKITAKDVVDKNTSSMSYQKSGPLRDVLESLAKMGNGVKWCTRKEWDPGLGNAYNYLITQSPEKTIFIVTKFNAPYCQCQADLKFAMDTNDRDVLQPSSKLHGTFELAEVFAKAAEQFTITSSEAKNRFLALVGIRTKKAIEYYRAKGFDEGILLANLSRPLEAMGYSTEEARDFYVKFILSVTNGFETTIYHLRRWAAELFDALLSMPLSEKAREFGLRLLGQFLTNEKASANIPNDKTKTLMKSYLEKITSGERDAELSRFTSTQEGLYLLAYCLFVQKEPWKEKEHLFARVLSNNPELKKLYDSLSGSDEVTDNTAQREEDVKHLVKVVSDFITKSEYRSDRIDWRMRSELRDVVLMYGKLPELEAIFARYSGWQQNAAVKRKNEMVEQVYKELLALTHVEEIED
jgi:hypothetical protein